MHGSWTEMNDWDINETRWMMEYPGDSYDLTEREHSVKLVVLTWEIIQTAAVVVFGFVVWKLM